MIVSELLATWTNYFVILPIKVQSSSVRDLAFCEDSVTEALLLVLLL